MSDSNTTEQLGRLYKIVQLEIERLQTLRKEQEKVLSALGKIKEETFSNNINGIKNGFELIHEDIKTSIDTIVDNKISETIHSINKSAYQASLATEKLDKFNNLQWDTVFKIALICMVVMSSGLIAGLIFNAITPDRTEVALLKQDVEQLNAVGGGADISTCDGQPCVRVKTKKTYGKNHDFMILKRK